MPRRYLFGLLLAFGLLALVYSLTTPLFEAPDEPWHYAYVRWLAEGHGLPRLDDDASGAQQEVGQPPLYYAVAALITRPVSDDDLPELFWHNPQFGFQAGGTVNDNKNMLIHTDRERLPWRGAVLAVRLARLVSLAFGLLAVGATYGLAREALPKRPVLVIVATGVVAFTPQFLFISGVVSNDSAAAAICTCALWALARIIHRGATPRRATAAGLVLGLALLSKTSALLLLPMALLALMFGQGEVSPASRTKRLGRVMNKIPWLQAALMLGIALAVGGWWYVRNWALFDDPLGLSVHVNTLWGRSEPVSLAELLSEMPQVFRSFWGAFGWGHVELFGVLYVALGLLVGLGLLGWAGHLLRLRGRAGLVCRNKPVPGALNASSGGSARANIGIYLLAAAWCLAVLVALLRWMQQVEAPHGRLLFPALGAWGLLLAVGWSGLIPKRYLFPAGQGRGDVPAPRNATTGEPFRLLLFLPVAGLLVLALSVPFGVIRPAFASPRMLSPEAAETRVISQALVYGDQARLLGYRVEPESVRAGERVKVTLCWETLRSMERDYTLFIHLLGRDNLRIGERTTYPGQGRFPTTLWLENRAFCESYWLEVASWAPTPELYGLEVGLYDAETNWRLPAQNAEDQPVAPPIVGSVRVLPSASPPQPQHALSYDLGGQIALVGYNSSVKRTHSGSAALGAGDTLTLTLYWQALQVPERDYTVFVHLLDGTGAYVTQDDAPPRGGRYPTWAWHPGDLVPDTHHVTLPDAAPPGPYYWSVGMYRPETEERLSVTGSQGALPDGAIRLEVIQD